MTLPIWGALLNGGTLMPYDLRVRGVAPLGAWLDHEQITVLHLVPGAFREFVATLKPGPNFPALRLLQLGGEAILPPDVELYKRYFDDRCLLRVGLGLTEAGGCPSMILLDKGAEIGGTVPAGYAMPDKELLILDDAGRTLAPGETGEIAVRSRFLAQGYWRRPELTAERFRSDTAGDGMRVYLTGDLGRLAPDGNLEHLGRKDHQIKIRGHRVELGEVESALRDLPGVIECAVAKRSWRGSDHLVGYLVCASNSHLNVSRVSRLLRARLPAQSVPSAYVFLETMPRTPAGKVDRAALPLPGAVRPDLDSRYTAPRNDTERTLCDLWEETLGVAPIGVEDNFFDLGGDSLSAARLFATLDAKFGRELPLPVLLQAPTVEQLAEVLKPEADAASWASVIPLQTRGTRSPLFCVDLRNAGIFLHLARRLGLDQPCYGLHPLGLGGAALRFSIPSLAEHFIGEVRRIQPTGPYYLSGLCAGGVAAFEMAQQLRAQGERVALLLLVDSFFPTFTRLPYAIVRPWSRFRRKWVLPAWQRLRGITPPLVSDEGPAEKADAEHEKHRNKMHAYLHAVRRASRHALMSYRPRPFDGRLVLFLAKDSTVDELHEPRERWRSVARGGVETFEFAGTHTGILAEPRVREVADRLRCLLDLADVKGS